MAREKRQFALRKEEKKRPNKRKLRS